MFRLRSLLPFLRMGQRRAEVADFPSRKFPPASGLSLGELLRSRAIGARFSGCLDGESFFAFSEFSGFSDGNGQGILLFLADSFSLLRRRICR